MASAAVAGGSGGGDGRRPLVPCLGLKWGCRCPRCLERRRAEKTAARAEESGGSRPKRGRFERGRGESSRPLRRGVMMRGRILGGRRPSPEMSAEEKRWKGVVDAEWEKVGGKGYLGSLGRDAFQDMLRDVVQQKLQPTEAVDLARESFLSSQNYMERTNFESMLALQHVLAVWEAIHGVLDREGPVVEPLDSEDERLEFPQEADDADADEEEEAYREDAE